MEVLIEEIVNICFEKMQIDGSTKAVIQHVRHNYKTELKMSFLI